MNWKSTALVSGAGVLATWLASVPSPVEPPRQTAAPVAAQVVKSDDDIDALARELAARADVVAAFTRPLRNPFRFGPVRVGPRVEEAPAAPAEIQAAAPAAPAGPTFRLVGVALDRVDDQDVWTAIVNAGGDVVLARKGDEIAPGVRVTDVSAESATLGRDDGTVLTLPLSAQ
jgi:hypothetical protein